MTDVHEQMPSIVTATDSDDTDGDGIKKSRKKYKFKSGTVCVREIKKIQKTTKLLIQKSPFKRIIKEITLSYTPGIIYQKNALEAMLCKRQVRIT